MSPVRATPFHARAADANATNLWLPRGGFTLAAAYGGTEMEAAAARVGVVMADISSRWRIALEGARAGELVQRLFTRDVSGLAAGAALKALWLNDGGGVRGAGVVARVDRLSYRLVSAAQDQDWIAAAASQFGVTLRDVTEEEGGLALIGPYAARLVASLGFDPALETSAFRTYDWKGLDVTLSRFGEHGGYEIWCRCEDGPLVWDRVVRAGEVFALQPAGLDAMDLLDIEAGVPRPGRDYDGATDADAAEPVPGEWRMAKLIDAAHAGFNGARPALTAVPRKRLAGLIIDSVTPAPFTPVLFDRTPVGRTLSSRYSPVLRRAIALAQLDEGHVPPGATVSVLLPASRSTPPVLTSARVTDLPFLPPPDPIAG